MKKVLLAIFISIFALFQFCFAGQLTQTGDHICYMQDDGTFAMSKWVDMDINADGVNESYYFDASGFLLTNTITPDGYQVNEMGQWMQNVPQVKNVEPTSEILQPKSQQINNEPTSNILSPTPKKKSNKSSGGRYAASNKVWICDTGSKYHTHKSCSKMKNPYQVTIGEAEAMGYEPCGKKECYGS